MKNNKEKENMEEQEDTRTTENKNRKNITMNGMSSRADDQKIAPPNSKSLKFGRSRARTRKGEKGANGRKNI